MNTKILKTEPHPLRESLLQNFRLWQLRKLLGGRPSECALSRYLSGIDRMPEAVEIRLREILIQHLVSPENGESA